MSQSEFWYEINIDLSIINLPSTDPGFLIDQRLSSFNEFIYQVAHIILGHQINTIW